MLCPDENRSAKEVQDDGVYRTWRPQAILIRFSGRNSRVDATLVHLQRAKLILASTNKTDKFESQGLNRVQDATTLSTG